MGNELSELGYGPCIIASENQGAVMANQIATQQMAAVTAGAVQLVSVVLAIESTCVLSGIMENK